MEVRFSSNSTPHENPCLLVAPHGCRELLNPPPPSISSIYPRYSPGHNNLTSMAWSKTTRISVMLVIDIVFFFVELIAGFTVHSLALLADAFHMLNDIISLLVGLWAVSVASKATTDKFSYGVCLPLTISIPIPHC